MVDESDDEDDEDEDGEGKESDQEDEVDPRNPYNLPESEDDEEEMAELRRRVLASKPFANPAPTTEVDDRKQPERIARTAPTPEVRVEDDSASEGNDLDDEFDSFMNAQPTTDRTGITAKQRLNGQGGKISATFTSASLKAPSRRG
jgi:pre-rRNA-processing protein TSR3